MWKLGTYRLTKVVFGNMGFSAGALVQTYTKDSKILCQESFSWVFYFFLSMLVKALNTFFSLVNVAAAFDTWTTVCEDYATQLEQEGQYHKAATYLLAAHKVYSAIDLFKRHRLFK